jgi:hypothetical protein
MSKVNFKIINKLLCAAFIVAFFPTVTLAQAQPNDDEQSLRAFLQAKVDDKETRYVTAFHDLSGNGTREALAYVVGNDWCGSGGCNLFILQKSGASWRVVSSITITRPPVEILRNISNGWHDLKVHVGGGGARPGVVTLRFNGRTYRKSPPVARKHQECARKRDH